MRGLLMFALLCFSGVAFAAGDGGDGGIPLVKIGLHAFNLALLLGVLYYFLADRIRDALANRSASWKRRIEDTQKAEHAAQTRFDEIERKLSGFEKELSRMRENAEAEAVKERELILSRADRQVEQIQTAARRSIRDETARARQQLRSDAAVLAVELATQKVASDISGTDRERLTSDFLSQLTTDASGVGHG